MLLANFNRKEHLRHRAVSLRQHGFLVVDILYLGHIDWTLLNSMRWLMLRWRATSLKVCRQKNLSLRSGYFWTTTQGMNF